MSRLPLLALTVASFLCASARAQFPFPISPETPLTGIVDFSDLNHRPAGKHGFVRRDGEHFVTDVGPIRFWGVNLCFGANFPEREEAEKLAAHLASLAVNCVRIHHHETQYSPSGLYDRDTKKLDPRQVAKLDHLLAQLHEHGIYANLNLHVGRKVARELGFPPLGAGHSAIGDKHLLHFFPPVQEAFWQYCRDYLGHTNPHRGLRRADDPGIAMIEILNENRFHLDGAKHLRTAPEPYRGEILKQWNAWLQKTYSSEDTLRAAWRGESGAGPGERLLTNPGHPLAGGWVFNDHGGKWPVELNGPADGVLRLAPKAKTDTGWHQQLYRPDLTVRKGQVYTLRFEARADAPRPLGFNLATLDGGWKSLGLAAAAQLKGEWQTFTYRFDGAADSAGGRLAFDLGGHAAAVEMRGVELRSGASWTLLPAGQSLAEGDIGIPDDGWSPAANAAFVAFMADTERAFYRKTRALLKELGVRVPVTTTQVNYQGAAMAAELSDYTDLHSYWHHPLFPGRQWDGDNWTIGHDPLEARPYANKWPRNNPLMRSSWRVHGMPFTYSEWNVGEPSFPSAGAVPVMALLGSLQDWSGVFFFDYASSAGRFDRDKVESYFSLCGQPAKLALLGPFGALYRGGALPSQNKAHRSAPDAHAGAGIHAFNRLVGIDVHRAKPPDYVPPTEAELLESRPPLLLTPDHSAVWNARDTERALVTINVPTVRALWGRIGGQTVELGGWKFEVGDCPRGYGVIIAQSRDGLPLSESKRILITSVSHAENRDFGWKNEERTAGGANWGEGPTQLWAVPFKLTRPEGENEGVVEVLSASGDPVGRIPAGSGRWESGQRGAVWIQVSQ